MKITNLARAVPIASATSTDTVLTINTSTPHLLVSGDLIALDTNNNKKYVVTVTSGTAFTIPAIIYSTSSAPFIPSGVVYPLGLVASGATSIAYSVGSGTDSLSTVQAIGLVTATTGGATINIEVSNDGINWIVFGTLTLTLGTTATTVGLVVNAPWAYIRANGTSITGTNAKVTILMNRNS